jgi:hypothetical protein
MADVRLSMAVDVVVRDLLAVSQNVPNCRGLSRDASPVRICGTNPPDDPVDETGNRPLPVLSRRTGRGDKNAAARAFRGHSDAKSANEPTDTPSQLDGREELRKVLFGAGCSKPN